MVSYGPWIQEPNFEDSDSVSVIGNPGATYETSRADGSWPIQNPPHEINRLPDLEGTYYGAISGLDGEPSFVTMQTGYTQYGVSASAEWSHDVEVNHFTTTAPLDDYFEPSEYDDDAIGLQYEGVTYDPDRPFDDTTATPVKLWLDTTFTRFSGRFLDFRSGTGSPLPWSMSSRLELVVGGSLEVLASGIYDTGVGGGSQFTGLPGGRIELTEHGLGSDFEGTFTVRTSSLITPSDEDLVWPNQHFLSYGWTVNRLEFTHELHPPRYRWIYATDDTPTYRRIFPRDDGLAGGAPRNFPPSKSTQSGNRTSGGYL